MSPLQCKPVTKMKSKNTSPFKRWRGSRLNACRVCNTGGELIECHTCKVVCHIKCSRNMPSNVQEIRVIWRCQECIQESGPTRCSFARYQANRIGIDVKSKITQSIQRQKARFDLSPLRSHDTKGDMSQD